METEDAATQRMEMKIEGQFTTDESNLQIVTVQKHVH